MRLRIVNVLGEAVQTLVNEELGSGTHYLTFDASSLGSGIYFAILSSNHILQTQKLILIE